MEIHRHAIKRGFHGGIVMPEQNVLKPSIRYIPDRKRLEITASFHKCSFLIPLSVKKIVRFALQTKKCDYFS